MLKISLSLGRAVRIGDIVVTITDIRGDNVRFSIDAPPGTLIHRYELLASVAKALGQQPPAITPPRPDPTSIEEWW